MLFASKLVLSVRLFIISCSSLLCAGRGLEERACRIIGLASLWAVNNKFSTWLLLQPPTWVGGVKLRMLIIVEGLLIFFAQFTHNTPCLHLKILGNHCFPISLGYYSRLKRIWTQFLCKFLGDKQVYYGECENGIYRKSSIKRPVSKKPSLFKAKKLISPPPPTICVWNKEAPRGLIEDLQ